MGFLERPSSKLLFGRLGVMVDDIHREEVQLQLQYLMKLEPRKLASVSGRFESPRKDGHCG